MDKKCKNCMKWDTQAFPKGFCKANAPSPTVIKGGEKDNFVLVWPSTGADDWCFGFEEIKNELV